MTVPLKKIHFIINPNSGRRRPIPIIHHLEKGMPNTIEWTSRLTQRVGHATELTVEAIHSGADAVVAVGGDGTVNEVGKALIGTSTALGIIPSGSGNGFARHLQIPISDKAAIRRIARFKTLTIDTATINGRAFLATAGLGFDAEVGRRFSEFDRRGLPSYLRASAATFFNFKPREYYLIIDGQEYQSEAFLINFANAGQYGNNAWIAPSASLTDGLLNVCILKKFPRHYAPDIIFRIFNKQIESSKYYEQFLARNITVKNAEQFHVDGEPLTGEAELKIEIIPHSLSVII